MRKLAAIAALAFALLTASGANAAITGHSFSDGHHAGGGHSLSDGH
jgi:hypothetical protein